MITKSHKEALKSFFFEFPTKKLRVREIERELKMPLPSVIRYVKELVSESLLKPQKIGSVTFYTSNRPEKKYLLQKRLHNLARIYDSGLIEYLIDEYSNPTILLFGSYSRGEDTEESDIDIYLETKSKKKLEIKNYETALNRKIQLFIFDSVRHIPNKELANNIINGISLN